MQQRFKRYAAERGGLLDAITDSLTRDEWFVAAWLGGSHGRNEADDLSDLDLFVVVADEYSDVICRREHQVAAGTTEERLAIVSQFRRPLVIHENHHNAPPGATFTAVIYEGTALQVDWTLIPQRAAQRPDRSKLLFEKVTIPTYHSSPGEDGTERLHKLAERWAFFWMMTVPTAKYSLRGDDVYFHILLDMLHRTIEDMERLSVHQPMEYQRGSRASLATTRREQIDALRALCERAQALEVPLQAEGVDLTKSPISTIQRLLRMANDPSET